MPAPKSSGELIANLLYQSWRIPAPALQLSEEDLNRITPQLLGSGAGALAWSQVLRSPLRDPPPATELQQAFRVHTLQAAAFEDDITRVMTLLDSVDVDPVLAKGWAVARLYPDTSLRPYGDIDLYVSPSEYSSAARALERADASKYVVDLHEQFSASDSDTHQLYERSQLVCLGNVKVRVPCHEDHLRILSLHMLRHGAWRPLWLCDIAVVLESRPADFNWDLCLGNNKRRADWIACCIGLAHQLLGAEVKDTPVALRAKNLPRWLVSNVLRQWELPYSAAQPPVTHQAPMSQYLRNPRGILADLRRRWPNPIEATVYVEGPFNEFPRLPFQIGECVARTAKFVARLPRTLREGR